MIELHLGHLIPMYNRMFPTQNNANALYSIQLNILVGIYFSINANTNNAAKPVATKVKYIFFCLFILSLSFMVYTCRSPFLLRQGKSRFAIRWRRRAKAR
jgi:hypothetical protein